ncbi:MAG TPA: class II fructose-bisphosphate aldolase [Candidatus Nanoarchaeia archaeon]|nr:class II fructose-bisphosphate aldolase [Candidatus Nanoarchaeia archaeon]
MLVTTKKILDSANKHNYAVGAFNISDLEILQGIVNAAVKKKSPVIIQTSQSAIEYARMENLVCMAVNEIEKNKITAALHLDHGTDMKIIKKAIKSGYTSVMIDGSHLGYKKNISVTRKVVTLAHKKGISVEGELGTIGGREDYVKGRIQYTDAESAGDFVAKTGIDSLAVAIGTSHGAYKFQGKAKLDIQRLNLIKKKVRIPLVLHGASGVPKEIVRIAKRAGAELGEVQGVPDSQIKLAVKNGINKINIDTDLRLAFTTAERSFLKKHPAEFDPRRILNEARLAVQKIAEKKIDLFGSRGK